MIIELHEDYDYLQCLHFDLYNQIFSIYQQRIQNLNVIVILNIPDYPI